MLLAQKIRDSVKPTLTKRIGRAIKRRTIGDRPVYWYFNSLPRDAGRIFFYPRAPSNSMYAVNKITACLRLELVAASDPSTATFAWDDATFCAKIENGHKVINGLCTDISKQLVGIEFEKAFGYPLTIDPTYYVGRAVYKSNENALHIGGVIECPIAARDPSLSYQVLIDSQVSDDFFEEFRIPIIGTEIPILYLKLNPVAHRFGNFMTGCALSHDPLLFISRQEIEQILSMTKSMRVDYAEIDALRDRRSGRLYVIDVNKTPFGPPAVLGFLDKIRAVRMMAISMEKLISQN